MSTTVTVTVNNELGKGVQDAAFALKVIPAPVMTAGTVQAQPQDVPNMSSLSHNAGIYANTAPNNVRGIVCYAIPDNMTQLVIFFSKTSSRLMTLAKGVQVDATTVDTAESKGSASIKGTYVVLNELFDYNVSTSLYCIYCEFMCYSHNTTVHCRDGAEPRRQDAELQGHRYQHA